MKERNQYSTCNSCCVLPATWNLQETATWGMVQWWGKRMSCMGEPQTWNRDAQKHDWRETTHLRYMSLRQGTRHTQWNSSAAGYVQPAKPNALREKMIEAIEHISWSKECCDKGPTLQLNMLLRQSTGAFKSLTAVTACGAHYLEMQAPNAKDLPCMDRPAINPKP